MSSPSRWARVRPGALIPVLLAVMMALAALPTLSPGVQQITIRTRVAEITRGLQADIGFNLRSLREELGTLPRLVDEGDFASTIEQIGDFGYLKLRLIDNLYANALLNVEQEIQNIGPDPHDAQDLRGQGGFADRAAEELNWTIPTEFAKDLAATLRRTRFTVEYFDNTLNDFRTSPVAMSVQVFPKPKDNLLFSGLESPMARVRVQGIVGGSYTKFNEPDAITSACVFGVAPPSTGVDVTASSDVQFVPGSTTSDSDGNWDVCFTTLLQGYYRFSATDNTTTDIAEQGFFVKAQF